MNPFKSLDAKRDELAIRKEMALLEREIRDAESDRRGFWASIISNASEQGAEIALQLLIYLTGFLMVVAPLAVNVVMSWTGHEKISPTDTNGVRETGRDVILISIGVKGTAGGAMAVGRAVAKKKEEDKKA